MAAKRCPTCGLVNPSSAARCDCGASFVDGSIGRPLELGKRTEHELVARRRNRAKGFTVVTLGSTFAAYAVRVLVRDGYHPDDAVAVVATFGVTALFIGVGIALVWSNRN